MNECAVIGGRTRRLITSTGAKHDVSEEVTLGNLDRLTADKHEHCQECSGDFGSGSIV
jgi:hypothetical protein